MNDKNDEKDYEWKDEQEKILKKWADKSLCFKMMHEKCYRKYWCLNAWFNIPVIIISTLTGTGNFASTNFPSYASTLILIFGALNIFSGILATISSYTSVAQRLEAHRYSFITWDKFGRKIQIELSKIRADRVKAKDFIKQIAEEYDRLIEMSPIIPNDVIKWFKTIVDTGKIEETHNSCSLCCYEWCGFPCGCGSISCNCFDCLNCGDMDEKMNRKQRNEEMKNIWKDIELPELIGYVKPIEIAEETPIVHEINIKKEEDIYNIYNMNP
jgi:hypothetical protein